ncbi:MAG: Cna B-type domain-containing protein [Acutalibacteraceae bacterium]|nr:Cna B-type domain-containing protein [Acutalibacteraceae bacterium]
MIKLFSKIRCSISVLIAVMLMLCISQPVMATEDVGSIKLSYQVDGVEFDLYKVGTRTAEGDIVLTDEFSSYQVDLESENAATTLASYIESDNKKPSVTKVTDKDFNANFTELSEGVYLIIGSVKTVDRVTYKAMPVMVSLPYWDNDTLIWDLEVKGKYKKSFLATDSDISVLKIWKDEGNESARPKEVTVSLTRNGEVCDTVKLNAENNWKYKWTTLDEEFNWSVIEQDVPAGYEVNIQQNGKVVVITNTYKTTDSPTNPSSNSSSNPSKPDLPQTGQLWWPVYALVFVGVCFLAIGVVRRRKNM